MGTATSHHQAGLPAEAHILLAMEMKVIAASAKGAALIAALLEIGPSRSEHHHNMVSSPARRHDDIANRSGMPSCHRAHHPVPHPARQIWPA